MGFKTITIKEKVFREISKAKGKDESFSDFFEKIVHKKKPDLLKFAGAWKLTKEEEERMDRERKEFRKKFEEEFEERVKRARR